MIIINPGRRPSAIRIANACSGRSRFGKTAVITQRTKQLIEYENISLDLVCVIEFAIFINMGIPAYTGTVLPFHPL